jgi:3-deoxy-D-manno-octulosonic-acid transferase
MTTETMMIAAYNLLTVLLLVLALPVVAVAALVSEKRRKSLLHRLWVRSMPGPAGMGVDRPVWVHALSVGEVRCALPLVRALRRHDPKTPVVVSASTYTGYQTAGRLMADLATRIAYFPYDLYWPVRRAARCIDPAMVIIMETDIWPNFIHRMAARKVPVVLANVRLSDRSFAGYRRLAGWSRSLFDGLAAICVQTEADAVRFQRLGVDPGRIHVTGSVKFDPAEEPPTADESRRFRKSLGLSPERCVLVAGSTHRGEEALLARALARIRRERPEVTLIVAPRDPGRARAACRVFETAGFSALCLEQREKEARSPVDVLVVDTLGLLGRLYALADLAFVGGSLVSRGGHNPLEPAALGRPVLFGPDMSDFRGIARLLTEAGGGRRVGDHRELADAALALLGDQPLARGMGEKARGVFLAHGGAAARILAVAVAALAKGPAGKGDNRTIDGGHP